MNITEDFVSNSNVQAIFDQVDALGKKAYFVGGCVRNALLNAPVHDIDIATSALPQEATKKFREAGLKVVPTGIDHGTITVVSGGASYEVTTFRKDIKPDGRRSVVAFSDDMLDDARRRDFTMNALYADRDGQVIDPLGGLPDLRARRVRFIEDAGQRIKEDYLRALRFFRFVAWYGDPDAGMDADALTAIATNLDGIDTLSAERVGAEMLKLLSAPDPAPAVAAMAATGALAHVLPGADARFLAPLIHVESGQKANPFRRLAVLGGQDVAKRLRLSKAQARCLRELLDYSSAPMGPAELGYRAGVAMARDALLVRAATIGGSFTSKDEESLRLGAKQVFPIKAADLTPDYVGAELGNKLKELEKAWVLSGFTLTRSGLLSR